MHNRRKDFIKNISWILGGRIIIMILQFLISLATARYLGPSNFGTINYVVAYVSFFSSVASLGLHIIIIKEVSSDSTDDNTVIWTSIWLRLLTAIFSSIAVIGLIMVMNKGDQTIVYIAVLESLSILFSAFDTFECWFRAKLLSKYSIIAGIIGYLGMSIYRIYLLQQIILLFKEIQ